MIPRSAVALSAENLFSPGDVKVKVFSVSTRPFDGAFETKGTAERVAKLNVAHYRYDQVLLSVNQISYPENSRHDIGDAQVHAFIQTFRAYGFDPVKITLSVTTTTAASQSKESGGAPLGTYHVFNEAVSVVLLNRRHRLRGLRGLHNVGYVAKIEARLLVR